MLVVLPPGILRAGLAVRRKNLRPPQQPGGRSSKAQICALERPAKPAQQAAKNPGGMDAEHNKINPPSRRVYNSKLQVNRPKSLSCIISSLAADLRDSSYRAAEQLSSPAAEQAAAGKVRACRSGASPHLAGYLGQVDVLT
jgi:hypothetical protein